MPIPPQLIALGLILLFALVAWYGFAGQRLLALIGIMLAPFLILLVNNLQLWFVITLAVRNAGFVFPGIPGGLHVFHVLMAGFVGLVFARNIIQKPSGPRWQASDLLLAWFLGVVLTTIWVRGFGIRALGGEAWGGMDYVKIFIAAGFLLSARYITLSVRHLRLAIIFMLLLAFVPAIAQIVFLFSGGQIYHQYHLIDVSAIAALSSLEAMESGGEVVRFGMLRGLAMHLFIALIAFVPFTGMRRFVVAGGAVFCFLLSGLSGFRIAILAMGGTLAFYILLQSQGRRALRLVQFGAAGLLVLLLLVPLTPHLPGSVQRSLTIFPFLDIPGSIKAQAASTSWWRIEVWKLAWAEVPHYLWLGKGFTLSPQDLASYSVRSDSILHAFLSHNYHSGPLTLLLDLGVFGFLTFTGFFARSGYEMLKNSRRIRHDTHLPPFLRRYFFLMLAAYLYAFVSFYLFYGDPRNIASAFINLAVLQTIYRTAIAYSKAAEHSSEKQQGTAPPNLLPPAL